MHLPSVSEWMVILVIIMMFFGVGKLPDVLKQFGKGVKEFKDASEGVERKGKGGRSRPSGSEDDERNGTDEDDEDDEDEERAAFEEFRRKRRAAKQLTSSKGGEGAAPSPRAKDPASLDDADADGDNDDAGSTPKKRAR